MAAHPKFVPTKNMPLTEGQKYYNAFIELLDTLNPVEDNPHHSAKMDQGVYDSLYALAQKYYEIQNNKDANKTADSDAIVMRNFLFYLQISIPTIQLCDNYTDPQGGLRGGLPALLESCLKNIEAECVKTPIHPALAAAIGGIVGAVIGAVVFGGLGLLMSLPIGGAGVFFGAFTGAIKGWSIGASVAIPLFSGLAGATMFGGSAHKKRKAIEASLNEASGLYQFVKQRFSPQPAPGT